MATTLPDVLEVFRTTMRSLPGLNPAGYPTEQDTNQIKCLVYPAPGRSQFGSSEGGNGYPNYWQFDTIVIEVFTYRSNLESDFKAVEPYTHLVPHAIMAAFMRDKMNGTVQILGDAESPESQWPIRRSLIFDLSAGSNMIGYQFEVDISYQVDIIYD